MQFRDLKVVQISDIKQHLFRKFLNRTPDDIYNELNMLRKQIDQLNNEITRLRNELRNYDL
jgi:conjugal transfer/entry exclusion protein